MSNKSHAKITPEVLKSLSHPSEDSRFDLALLVAIPLIGFGLLALTFTWAILGFITILVFVVWFTLRVAKAHLTSNAVKVSEKNFPEVYKVLKEVLYVLDYNKPVDVYIVEEGSVNAWLAKFFETKFIVLNSELVEEMLEHDTILQTKWVIARFVGALKAKHYRLWFLRIVIDSIEKIKIFNIFLLPYERATQYSGDQIGLAVCGDLRQAMLAFQKFMVGNKLSSRVELEGIKEQKGEMGFFSTLARLPSAHPHVVDRFHNLLAFAQANYPEMYESYMNSQTEARLA